MAGEKFVDSDGFSYGKDSDSLYRYKGEYFEELAIYHGDGKWTPYSLENINVFTDLSSIEYEDALEAQIAVLDAALGSKE